MFVVSTENDHVAPWQSVYKINLVADTEVTFVLTSGGHNAGIVSEPNHKGRHFRLGEHRPINNYVDPQEWYLSTPASQGSWWIAWINWLEKNASGITPPPEMGANKKGYPVIGAAPGNYVLER